MSDENNDEFVAPPIPEEIPVGEPAQMSEAATLLGIFYEPGRVFADLRRKPRFIFASIIIALVVTGYAFGLQYKVGEAGMRSVMMDQINKSSRADAMSNEDKAKTVDLQMKISGYTRYAVPIFVFISLLLGGLFYWLGAKAFGGTGGFLQNLSVWVYAGLPPALVSMVASYIVLYFKDVDQIDVAASQRGVVNANLGMLLDGKAMPVIATVVATADLFFIWGWILAAIGLRTVNKLSAGSAWAVTIIFALVGIAFRIVGAYFSGNVN